MIAHAASRTGQTTAPPHSCFEQHDGQHTKRVCTQIAHAEVASQNEAANCGPTPDIQRRRMIQLAALNGPANAERERGS